MIRLAPGVLHSLFHFEAMVSHAPGHNRVTLNGATKKYRSEKVLSESIRLRKSRNWEDCFGLQSLWRLPSISGMACMEKVRGGRFPLCIYGLKFAFGRVSTAVVYVINTLHYCILVYVINTLPYLTMCSQHDRVAP